MAEILFLIGFLVHNHAEEALWFPEWSKGAGKFHKTVSKNEFNFAAVVISALGILVTFQYLIPGNSCILPKYLYLGFVLMMVLNAIFPHLTATIVLRKYCPGVVTGILLNLPIGIYLVVNKIENCREMVLVIIAAIAVSIFSILLIILSFKFGRCLDK